MKVSIITVCFNSEQNIEQTIQSVVSQTYSNIEYIVVDGNSTDETLSIIKKYFSLYPETIKYISEADKGIYDAMNKGIALADGEIIGIINSDDWYDSTTVEKIVEAYKNYGEAVYHGIQRTYSNNEITRLECTSSTLLFTKMIEHPTCFVPRQVYAKFGLFKSDLKFVGDYEFMLRLKKNNVKFIMLESILANFREGGASHSFEAVQENYRLWLNLGILTSGSYFYRITMDRLKLLLRKSINS